MTPKNVKTESITCNRATGAQAIRYTADFDCICPHCGDKGPHPGKGESARESKPEAGSYSIWCNWCGERFEGPAVA